MKIKIISSGSKGNSTFIESEGTRIIIDVGVNFQKLSSSLEEINESIYNIDGILISHEHHDHIGGLSSVNKKIDVPIFVRKDLELEISKCTKKDNINIIENEITIGSFNIKLFPNSHDVPNSGYLIESNGKSIVYITDTGYINRKNISLTKDKDIYIIESNHDEEMLMNGKYPYMLKQRVLSDSGHLSNKAASSYLRKVIGNNTKYIILAHISENNNTYELAYENAKEELKDIFDIENLIVAYQKEGARLISI